MTITSPPRGHTAAEAEARYIPGLKSPIDLPDDFGIDDPDHGHTISWMAGCFTIILIIAAGAVLWAVMA